jgi:hypothetical protein
MTVQIGNLAAAVTELEQALDDGAPDPSQRLEGALAGLEQAAREHALLLDPVHGKLIDVDRPLIPSPGLARHECGLRQELGEVVADAAALRERLAEAAGPDLGRLRERARQLAEALDHFNEQEARLIQDSVITDIGAGD